MRWPKHWSFSFGIIPSKEIPGLIQSCNYLSVCYPRHDQGRVLVYQNSVPGIGNGPWQCTHRSFMEENEREVGELSEEAMKHSLQETMVVTPSKAREGKT